MIMSPTGLVSALLLAASTQVQTVPPQPAPIAPSTAPGAEVIAFGSDQNDRMTVPVSIGGSGPYAFLIDTGAERTVISRELARRLALNESGSLLMHSVTGSERVGTVMIPSLNVSTQPVNDVRAPALDEQHLGAAGLLGIDSLRNQKVTLDFKAGTMTVVPGDRPGMRAARRDPDEIIVTARRKAGQLIMTGATINGANVDVIIDTGAQISIGNEVLQRRLMGGSLNRKRKEIEIMSVTGDRTQASYTSVREINLGGAMIRNMPVAFSAAPIFRTLGLTRRPALLLGMDALRMFDRVSVDFASRKVRLLLPDGAGRDNGTRMVAMEPSRYIAL
jgi:predicted aspartyl protease